MSHRTDTTMDELPDLQSDADVDALMSRLRARVAPPASPSASTPAEASAGQGMSGDPIRDLTAAQDAFATAVLRAMHVVADTLEDLESDASERAQPVRTRRRGVRAPVASRKGARRSAR